MVRNLNLDRLARYFPLLKRPDREVTNRLLMLLAAFLFGLLIPSRFSVTMTPSLIHRIYLISRIADAREIRKDSYVLFTMRNSYIRNGQPVDVMSAVVAEQKHEGREAFGPCAGDEDRAVRPGRVPSRSRPQVLLQ